MSRRKQQYPGRPCRPDRGFSLLEMLLAVLVFGLMASAAYGVLNSISSAAAAQESSAQRLSEAQLAVLRLERELRQTLSAGMFASGETAPGLQGSPEVLEFSFLSPQALGKGPVIRQIHYRFENRTLYRIPDTAWLRQSPAAKSRVLLRDVSQLRFSYLDARGNWLSRWGPGSPGDLPAAVRLNMELERFGVVERLFELPGDRP